MLRDIALFGNASFRSDIDFVIDPFEPEIFEKEMASIGAKVNRFGGYALPFGKWQVDVWSLKKTWAHMAGHIQVETFDDLKNTTFFCCDAIFYDLSAKKIHAKQGYFEDLGRRILEVNLLPNPNPKGNVVRALRYSILKGFFWGPQLTKFVAEIVDQIGWRAISEIEQISFHTRYIEDLDHYTLGVNLLRQLTQQGSGTFDPRLYHKYKQFELPYCSL
jgi:hypothetical protein